MEIVAFAVLALIGLGIGCIIYTRRISASGLIQESPSLFSAWLQSSFFLSVLVGMAFTGLLIILGFLDARYTWTLQGILGMIVFGVLVSFVVILGSTWQFFIVGKYRDWLFSRIKKG